MPTHWYVVWERIVGHPTKLLEEVHDRRLAFLVGQQDVIQQSKGERCSGASVRCRIEAVFHELLVCRRAVHTFAEADLDLVNSRRIDDHHHGGAAADVEVFPSEATAL